MSVTSLKARVKEYDDQDFEYFCGKILDLTGISLGPEKYELLYSRLHSRLGELGLNAKGYRHFLEEKESDDPEWQVLVNLITTNKTNFFREMAHFVYLIQKIIPRFIAKSVPSIKVWSCAASSGQEAYSIAMALDRHLPKNIPFEILATDIDTTILKKAQNAVYPLASLYEIPPQYHPTCIERGTGKVANWFRIKKSIRERVIFKQHNLIDDAIASTDKFDIIFCRNVMIYFKPPTIQFIANKLYSVLDQNGHFFIGHAESLQAIDHGDWDIVGPSIYSKAFKF